MYGELQDHLQKEDVRCHTYAMGKIQFQVVVRGLLISTDLKDIYDDLCSQGIEVTSAYMLYPLRVPKRELPLILVEVKIGQDQIFKVMKCLDLVVRVENQGKRSVPATISKGTVTARCNYVELGVGRSTKRQIVGRSKNDLAKCALCE